MKNNVHNDYVVQLMSGRFDEKGKFLPFKLNPNTSITEIIRSSDKSIQEIMVKENLWPSLVSLDKSVFVKNSSEKEDLKKIKVEHKKQLINAGFNPKKRLNLSEPTTLNV
jgi:hypothetical protein